MAEFIVKKWPFGRVLAAKNTEKAAFYVFKAAFYVYKAHFLRIQHHLLRIQSHKQAHYRAQVTRLPRCKNNITAARV